MDRQSGPRAAALRPSRFQLLTPPNAPALPTLHLVDVACRRGERLLFEHVRLDVPASHLVWLRGRNGSGKTSLLRIVIGLSGAEDGEVRWGSEPVRASAAYRQQLVHIGHANALKDDLTAAESLAFLAGIHGRDTSPAALQGALDLFGLWSRRRAPVRTLSQGQRRRVTLARLALEDRPGLWVLDEPFDALDTDATQCLNALLAAHLARAGSVLLTSHVSLADPALQPIEFDLDRHAP